MRTFGPILIATALVAAPRAAQAGGACTALQDGSVLVVKCDDADNSVFVTQTAPGEFLVVGDDDTLINGADSAVVLGTITGIKLDLRDGEDVGEVSGVSISGKLDFRGGNGPNELTLSECSVGEVFISNKIGGSEANIEDCFVGGNVTVDNRDGTDQVKIKNTEITGDVRIENHEGDIVTGEGSEVNIEDGSLVHGKVKIVNQSGFDEFGLEEATVVGAVSIDNGVGDLLSGLGGESGVAAGFVGGDLVIINRAGFDEFDLDEGGEVAGTVKLDNASGGSDISIENAVIGVDLKVENHAGFDLLNLDETEIGGAVSVTQGAGGSDLVARSTSGSGAIVIGGKLTIETGNGVDRITLRVLEVGGSVKIATGSGDDALDVTASSFGLSFSADGKSGFDSFLHSRCTFGGSPSVKSFEQTGPAGLLPLQLNEFRCGFDDSNAPLEVAAIDPAGLTWHAPSGHLFISDSEIDEVREAWAVVGANVFEVSLAGDVLYAAYDLTALGNEEPSGITYNEFDGFFYVSNDETQTVTRYAFDSGTGFTFNDEVNTLDTAVLEDPEDVTSDPATGLIYVVDGHAQAVAIYEYSATGFALVGVLDLSALNHVADVPTDPEGIGFDPCTGHLLLTSDIDEKIYEYTAGGLLVKRNDLGELAPGVIAPQGLAFGPASDGAVNLSMYISDGGVDNNNDEDERDGRIYEVESDCSG